MESSSSDSFSNTTGQELASLAPLVALHRDYESLQQDAQALMELLQELEEEEDEAEMMRNELEENQTHQDELRPKLQWQLVDLLLLRDNDDTSGNTSELLHNAIVEVRAGTGGDEASLFASELAAAYRKTATNCQYQVDLLNNETTDLGGIKEQVFSIAAAGRGRRNTGDEEDILSQVGPYGLFQYESGVHRVQRVPVNDSKIHTSACSVAVLPMVPDDGNSPNSKHAPLLPLSELRIETMRSSGAGGQHVNTTDSAVRITHLPTGITASIQDGRSQHQNKDQALKLIAARVRDQLAAQAKQERGQAKSALLGSGDRSERIRTYNFPQDRVTDHRCHHTTHGITKLLDGAVEDGLVAQFFPHLRAMDRQALLEQLEEEDDEDEDENDGPGKKGNKKKGKKR